MTRRRAGTAQDADPIDFTASSKGAVADVAGETVNGGSDAPSVSSRDLPAVVEPPPEAPGDESPLIAYDQIPPELAEALRAIVNRNELRSGAPLPRTLFVASALPGEGVTTVSQSLATLVAQEMGKFVCWVDCSWLNVGTTASKSHRPTLIDILADNSRITEAMQVTPNFPELVSLSPGPLPEASRNKIARSPELERLLNLLTDEFDHVVFDLPPLLSNANSMALLRHADATLLVVRHRETTMAQVRRSIEAMQPTRNLAVVLNQFESRVPGRLRRLLGD